MHLISSSKFVYIIYRMFELLSQNNNGKFITPFFLLNCLRWFRLGRMTNPKENKKLSVCIGIGCCRRNQLLQENTKVIRNLEFTVLIFNSYRCLKIINQSIDR